MLAKFKHSGQRAQGCGLRAGWLYMILASRVYQKAVEKPPEQVGVVRTPFKQMLHLAPLQDVMWSLPIGAHKNLQGARVMLEPHKDLAIPGEWLVACTLSKVHKEKVLVQLISHIIFPQLSAKRSST